MHVSAGCPDEDANGSAAAPFGTLGQALSAARDGDTLLVAAGTYRENIVVDKRVTIVGPSGGDYGEEAGIIVQAPDSTPLTIGAVEASITGVRIQGAQEAGVVVRGGTLTLNRSWISDTQLGERNLGYGITARDNGSIILQQSSVIGSQGTGVLLFQSQGIILQNQISRNEGGGVRCDRTAEETRIEGNILADNAVFAVGAFGARAIILQNQIQGVRMGAGPMAEIGDGIIASSAQEPGPSLMPASVEATENTITGAGRVGVLCSGSADQIILQNNGIDGSTPDAGPSSGPSFGAGIWLQRSAGAGASGLISDNTITNSRFVGIGVTGEGSAIILQNNEVRGTIVASTFDGGVDMDIGDGIGVFAEARAQVTGNRVLSNGRIGIVVDAASSATSVTGNTIEQNQYGIVQQNLETLLDTSANMVQLNTERDRWETLGPKLPTRFDDFSTQAAP